MLRARLSNGVQLLGLDAENIRRLKAGEPIFVSLSQTGGTDDVGIVYGDSVQDIVKSLEEASGEKMPVPKSLDDLVSKQ